MPFYEWWIFCSGLGWSYPCDIWSVGCILVELCSVCISLILFVGILGMVHVWFNHWPLFTGWDAVPDPRELGTSGNDGESSRSSSAAHAGKSRVWFLLPVLLALLTPNAGFETYSSCLLFINSANMQISTSEEEDWTGQKEQQQGRALELFSNCHACR